MAITFFYNKKIINGIKYNNNKNEIAWNGCEVPISLSSLSDKTGGSGSGGEAFVGGGPQGHPPYTASRSYKIVKM